MRKIVLLILLLGGFSVYSQELNCKVKVNYSQLDVNTSGDRDIFPELERSITEFMNGQRWTNDIFQSTEKIKCNLNINLQKSNGQYSYMGNAQFQVIRPVYGTTYETLLINFVDRSFDFTFTPENRQMIFSEQNYTSNLTSMLAFYALTAIALDYDSFGRLSANPYIDRLYNIVNLAGTSGGSDAWKSTADIRDRYWILENLRNPQFLSFREGFYDYHRLGLDVISTQPADTKKVVLGYLEKLQTLNTMRPNSSLINLFFDAKSEEIVNIFSDSSKKEREQVFKMCSSMSADKTDIFRRLL